MTTRVYVPTTPGALRRALAQGALEPGPGAALDAHAVTDALRAEAAGADEEEWEYLALLTAAQHSLRLPDDRGSEGTEEDPGRRRLVVACDVARVDPGPDDEEREVTSVRLPDPVAWRRVASVHADLEDAAESVAAARAAYAAGSADADALAERCLDHELAWFAAQEADRLL